MCLVIAVWDKKSGVMASEGRMVSVMPVSVGGNDDGTIMRTVSDEHFKVHRLNAELVLGAVGDTHVVEELRSAIAASRAVCSFLDMRDTVIPRQVAASREKHPHGCFRLLLMGVSSGKVCLAEWASGSPDPTVPVIPNRSIGTIASGYSIAGMTQAADSVFDALIRRKRFLPAEQETHAALARIFDDLSKDNPEINNRMRFESVHVPTLNDASENHKLISQGQTQANLFEDPGDTEVVVFEATSRLTGFQGNQLWMGATGASKNWGSCNVHVSQDGTTYKEIGSIDVVARLGTLDSTFASGSDTDTTNALVVDLVENSGSLEAGTATDADLDTTLCFVDGELISYSAAAISGQDQYTLNTYIRRGRMGSTISSHAPGSLFMRLDDAVFKFTYDPTWAGKTVYFKFQSVNTFGNSPQDLSTLTPVTFVIPGANPGTVDASSGVVLKKHPRPLSPIIPRFPIGVGHLGWAPVNTAPVLAAKGSGTPGAPASLNTTGATLLVVLLGAVTDSNPVTLTDSKGNTWNYLTEQNQGSVRMRIAYAYSPTVGTGHTFTIDSGHPNAGILVYAFKNTALGSGVFDAENGDPNVTGFPFQPGSVAALAGDLVVMGYFTNFYLGNPISINDGFSAVDLVSNTVEGVGAYLLSAPGGSLNPTVSSSGPTGAVACIACFKGA